MSEPDFEKLKAANDELEQLVDDGKLTKVEFARLLADAEKAVGDREEFLEGIIMRGVELGFVKL